MSRRFKSGCAPRRAARHSPTAMASVVTRIIPPFVVNVCEGEAQPCLSGISIELWRKSFERLFGPTSFTLVETNAEAIAAVRRGAADVFVGGATVTEERSLLATWTKISLDESLGMITNGAVDVGSTTAGSLDVFASPWTYAGVGVALFIVGALGLLTWMTDRLTPDATSFTWPSDPARGIPQAAVGALKTLMGDVTAYTPVSSPSKAFKVFLSFGNLAVFGAIAAIVALLVSNSAPAFDIDSFDDLGGQRVGVGPASNAPASFVRHRHPTAQPVYGDIADCFPRLASDIAACVYDLSYLAHVFERERASLPPSARLIAQGGTVGPYSVGWASRLNDTATAHLLQRGLVHAVDTGTLSELEAEFLDAGGETEEDFDAASLIVSIIVWLSIITPILAALVCAVLYRRLRRRGARGAPPAVAALVLHQVLGTERWKRERAAFLSPQDIELEDGRREASLVVREEAIPYLLRTFGELHASIDALAERIEAAPAVAAEDAARSDSGFTISSDTDADTQ